MDGCLRISDVSQVGEKTEMQFEASPKRRAHGVDAIVVSQSIVYPGVSLGIWHAHNHPFGF